MPLPEKVRRKYGKSLGVVFRWLYQLLMQRQVSLGGLCCCLFSSSLGSSALASPASPLVWFLLVGLVFLGWVRFVPGQGMLFPRLWFRCLPLKFCFLFSGHVLGLSPVTIWCRFRLVCFRLHLGLIGSLLSLLFRLVPDPIFLTGFNRGVNKLFLDNAVPRNLVVVQFVLLACRVWNLSS